MNAEGNWLEKDSCEVGTTAADAGFEVFGMLASVK
jgi:hypothetical protein